LGTGTLKGRWFLGVFLTCEEQLIKKERDNSKSTLTLFSLALEIITLFKSALLLMERGSSLLICIGLDCYAKQEKA